MAKPVFVMTMTLAYCGVVALLIQGTAHFTGRSFLETFGNLWIVSLFGLVVTIASTVRIIRTEDPAEGDGDQSARR